MDKQYQFRLVTPVGVLFHGQVVSVSCPGTEGRFQILFNHAPMLAALDIGELDVLVQDSGPLVFAVSGGVAQVLHNEVLILANAAERRENIDVRRAESAKARAEERLAVPSQDVDLDRARAALFRAINRLKVAGKA